MPLHPANHHAVLVLARSQPAILAAALLRYAQLGWTTYVHLDARESLANFQHSVGPLAQSCRWISDRHAVYWAGFSMIEATLSLIHDARAAPLPHRRYTLLSDDTLPLWSDEALTEWSRSSISWIETNSSAHHMEHFQRYQGYYFFDHPLTALRREVHAPEVDETFIRAIADIESLRKSGKKTTNLHHGQQWWSLTAPRIDHLLVDIGNDLHLKTSFRYASVPDESYFQTLVAMRGLTDVESRSPCFVDWNRDPKPYVFTSVDELPAAAITSPFARKFTVVSPPPSGFV